MGPYRALYTASFAWNALCLLCLAQDTSWCAIPTFPWQAGLCFSGAATVLFFCECLVAFCLILLWVAFHVHISPTQMQYLYPVFLVSLVCDVGPGTQLLNRHWAHPVQLLEQLARCVCCREHWTGSQKPCVPGPALALALWLWVSHSVSS